MMFKRLRQVWKAFWSIDDQQQYIEPPRPEPLIRARYLPQGSRNPEWRMFTMEELIRGFSMHDVRKCPYCGTVYTALMRVKTCEQCGGALDDKIYKVVQKVTEQPVEELVRTIVRGRGMIQIRCDDGDIQIEPFTMPEAVETFAKFDNTDLNFFVNRKNGQIVDIVFQSTEVEQGKLEFRVNGKRTGIVIPTFAIQPSVNNRMRTSIPLAAGAAVQLTGVR